jgi:ATP-dependent Clp protease protease subunit
MSFFAKSKGKTGEVFIYEEIGDGWFGGISAQSFLDALKEVGDCEHLDIYINSPGGSVFDGVTIYNQLKRHKAKKRVYVDGLAASIASVIAMAGDEITMAANAMMMIHDPWGMAVGTADDMRKSAETLEAVKGTLIDTYVARTGRERAEVEQWMSTETWMDAKTSMERGFCTAISQDSPKAAAASPLLAKFKNTPDSLKAAGRQSNVLLAKMEQRLHRLGQPKA